MIVRRGEHLLRHMSCLQTLVALSSGEAEYYALIRGACTSFGTQSHYQDWMIDVPIQIHGDSSAARSVARRRGIGVRLRHFADTSFVVAESSGAWSLEVLLLQVRKSSRYTHETIAGT